MIDAAWLAAIAAAGAALIAVGTFWMNFGGRVAKAEGTASAALQTAAETEADLRRLEKEFSEYREAAIEKFVMTDTLNAIKSDLVEAQALSEQRLIDAVKGVSDRLDTLIAAGLQAQRGAKGKA